MKKETLSSATRFAIPPLRSILFSSMYIQSSSQPTKMKTRWLSLAIVLASIPVASASLDFMGRRNLILCVVIVEERHRVGSVRPSVSLSRARPTSRFARGEEKKRSGKNEAFRSPERLQRTRCNRRLMVTAAGCYHGNRCPLIA